MNTANTDALIDAVRAHALRCYEQGWDIVIECYDDADLLDMIGAATTADAAIKSVAATLDLEPAPLTGFVVTNEDVDGTSRRVYQSYRFAAERYEDMSGRKLPACVEDWLRCGIRSSVSAVGDFGNRVTIQFFSA